MVKKKFEFLEHTADVYIAAYGSSLEEAFENAALATTAVMSDVDKIKAKTVAEVKLEAFDEEALLYLWIEEILVRFDLREELFSYFKVFGIKECGEGLTLEAEIRGETFDPARHPQKLGVKAVTYYRMEIRKRPGNVTLRFVLDA